MIPTFAVVGQPNKGKSSIVATLAEDERLAIGPTPGDHPPGGCSYLFHQR